MSEILFETLKSMSEVFSKIAECECKSEQFNNRVESGKNMKLIDMYETSDPMLIRDILITLEFLMNEDFDKFVYLNKKIACKLRKTLNIKNFLALEPSFDYSDGEPTPSVRVLVFEKEHIDSYSEQNALGFLESVNKDIFMLL